MNTDCVRKDLDLVAVLILYALDTVGRLNYLRPIRHVNGPIRLIGYFREHIRAIDGVIPYGSAIRVDAVVAAQKILRSAVRRIVNGSKLVFRTIRHMQDHFPVTEIIKKIQLPLRQTTSLRIKKPIKVFIGVSNLHEILAADPPTSI